MPTAYITDLCTSKVERNNYGRKVLQWGGGGYKVGNFILSLTSFETIPSLLLNFLPHVAHLFLSYLMTKTPSIISVNYRKIVVNVMMRKVYLSMKGKYFNMAPDMLKVIVLHRI